ncbi:MAG: HAMP domain-containing sensor histidine kinase, partial [Deltaproteobacteria bacterium]
DSVKLEAGGAEARRERVDPVALVQAIVDAMPEENRARIVLRMPEPRSQVMGDRTQLERVLDNLIANALKYSPSGAPVVVEIARDGERLTASVTDQGAGIPAEHQQRVFERFYRVPGTRAEGLGLGLYITRMIVERHGGSVGVESAPDGGSRFHVTLPIAPPVEPAP